ncbi:hypothetical protein NZ30_13615 [Xanthomonas translucens pv. undulosa]|nr:hypothetical protein NZ30_13615 [Xanthomonas translucens pv. undulosa]
MVFQAHAELARHHDHRLVAAAHARRQRQCIAAHQVRRLVDAHAAAVAGAVRQSRQAIVRAQAGRLQHLARRLVHRRATYARTHRGERGRLRVVLQLPDAPLLLARFAEDVGTGDVGVVTVHGAAGIDQHQFARTQGLHPWNSVRVRGGIAELHDAEGGAVVGAERAMRLVDEAHQLGGGDAFVDQPGGQPLHLQGHVAGLLHQRQFRRRLAHAAAIHDRRRVADRDPVQHRAEPAVHGEGDARIQRQRLRAEFAQRLGDQPVRVLVFFP